MIRFVVNEAPVAQPRQRVGTDRAGRVRAYRDDGHPVHAFKDAVHLAAAGSVMWLMANGGMFTGPVELRLTFVMPRPKRLGNGGRQPFSRKPDFDNLAKAVSDALSKRVLVDDSQVCRCVLEKWYAASGEKPHVVVEVLDFGPRRAA